MPDRAHHRSDLGLTLSRQMSGRPLTRRDSVASWISDQARPQDDLGLLAVGQADRSRRERARNRRFGAVLSFAGDSPQLGRAATPVLPHDAYQGTQHEDCADGNEPGDETEHHANGSV